MSLGVNTVDTQNNFLDCLVLLAQEHVALLAHLGALLLQLPVAQATPPSLPALSPSSSSSWSANSEAHVLQAVPHQGSKGPGCSSELLTPALHVVPHQLLGHAADQFRASVHVDKPVLGELDFVNHPHSQNAGVQHVVKNDHGPTFGLALGCIVEAHLVHGVDPPLLLL